MGSNGDQAVAWRALCFELARALKCLPSVSVGGNRHVLAAAEEAQAAREAQDAGATVRADDGTAFLCRIWGEDIDHTLTAIVADWDGVRRFCVEFYTGSEEHTAYDGSNTLATIKENFEEHEADQRGGAYTEQWEIGGLSIERICDCTPQTAPTAAARAL